MSVGRGVVRGGVGGIEKDVGMNVLSSTNVGVGVSIAAGKGVGRPMPGVGARVLLVPAWVAGIRKRAMIDFIVD